MRLQFKVVLSVGWQEFNGSQAGCQVSSNPAMFVSAQTGPCCGRSLQDADKHVRFAMSSIYGKSYVAQCRSDPSRSALAMANIAPLIDVA